MFIDVPIEDTPLTTVALGHKERCDIVAQVAKEKFVPQDYLNLLIISEGGKKGSTVRNSNGSYDLGVAQVNTIHASFIEKKYPGSTWQDVALDPKLNISISADIFRRCLNHPLVKNNVWEGVGCYNSMTVNVRTPYVYRTMKVWDRINKSAELSCQKYW
ncbi:lytic transglycosylase domain-containing protein (plasmid) [Vibrio sp. SS-MA-C1-2]|uniref:lytic transglycosylase domain-containing protein n=1 Tax=Vibrio sp. SS-MA-C1-2 TaxID=2908646 RepID=UPI001F30C5EE|nr:lytic transglycosylase domain-containing protein [Vibrio sp. SS-MA-C1-2]UJF20331.1 lytic transglycosylase domain-containing protein [Vibrio sp. SS-MA-C1-2]